MPAKAITLASLVGISAWLSITLTREPGSLSTLWLASGFLCGVLVTSPRTQWPVLLLAAALANFGARALHQDGWFSVLGLGGASLIEAYVVARWVARSGVAPTDANQAQRSAAVALRSTLVACLLSAAMAAGVLTVTGNLNFGTAFVLWFASHVLGLIIFATLTVVVVAEGGRLLGPRGRRRELALAVALTAVSCVAIFSQSRYPLLFLIYVPLMLLVFRYRFAGVVFGTSVVALVALTATFFGSGPLMLIAHARLTEQTLLLQLFVASTSLLTLPVALAMTERALLMRRLREGEARYRMLTDFSMDIVVRIRADGERLYISPAVTELLGWDVNELRSERWELVHPDDVAPLRQALADLYRDGGSSVITYRALHKAGHYVWIEAHARLVPNERGGVPDVIYSGRDVTARVEAQAAMSESRRLLQAIADNVPAVIAYFNRNGVYEFANAATGELLDVDPQTLIGRTLREAAGEETYAAIQRYVIAALCGERVTYERFENVRGVARHYEVTFIPDVIADGSVRGFFALSYDVSERKRIEFLLDRLAREDALTRLPNRREFEQRAQQAVAARHVRPQGLVLMLLDVDHFKQINDTHGHHVGDAVLAAVAQRLKSCVHDEDLVARLGGDEFAIVIDRDATPANANRIAERIVAAMGRAIACDGKMLNATLSVGVAYAEQPASVDWLARLADRALYAAKAAGRNGYRSVIEPTVLPAVRLARR